MYKKLLIGTALLTGTLTLHADATADLNAKVDALTEEISKVKDAGSGEESKLSFGGYGKMDYTNFRDGGQDKLDIYRFIMYMDYEFSDRVKLVSEIEWEHGGRESTGGYGIVEQAYLDFKVADNHSVKVGHVLVPVGHVNLYHEPTAFNAVSRPEVEKYIVPSTWHENGIIAHGSLGNSISYQAGMVAGLRAGNDSKGKGIRSMRQNGQKSKAEDFAGVVRVDYKGASGFSIGASALSGSADQSDGGLAGVKTTVAEIHTAYNINGLQLRALYAMSKVDEAQKIAIKNAKGAQGEGSGFYVNAAYAITNEWTPFVRYEQYNTRLDSYDGAGAKQADGKDITSTTIGINYFAAPNVVLKADYVMRDNRGTDDDRIELGMGYSF